MSILSLSIELGERLEHLQKLKNASGIVGELEQRNRDLRPLQVALREQLQKAKVLFDQGVLDQSKLESIDALKDKLHGLMEQVKQDHTEITKGSSYKNLLKGIRNLTLSIEQATTISWKAYSQLNNPIDQGFLDLVSRVPGYRDKVRDIRKMLDSIKDKGGRTPDSVEDLEEFNELRDRFSIMRAQLNPDDWPPEVLSFLQKAQNEMGAPYDELNDEVSKWMKDNDIYKNIRIVLRAMSE